MNMRDFLADREIRRNRREADEPMARRAETIMALLAAAAAIVMVFA